MDERSSGAQTPSATAEAPPVATAAAADAPRKTDAAPPDNSVKETVESILVAFILAFIFRAFVVEAFVIPTGSMAPTLLGAHMRFACPDCGYRFDANYSDPASSRLGADIFIPSNAGQRLQEHNGQLVVVQGKEEIDAYCPNCGFRIPPTEATNPDVHYGDRILVLKYLYLFQDPERWDVVVFKSPDPPGGISPDKYDYSQNYIKRLVGRPNESILVLDGDVYKAAKDADRVEQFEVQTKPRHVQSALWRVIYNNDHRPRGLPRGGTGATWQQPWTVTGGTGWDLAAGPGQREFRFDAADGSGTLAFDADANPEQNAFTDWLAYDVETPFHPSSVGDLKLRFFYHRTAGDGPLRLSLTRLGQTFVAELTPTEARLLKVSGGGGEVQIGDAVPLPGGEGPVEVEFQNVDYQVALRVAGQDLLRTTPDDYRPDVARLLEAWRDRERLPRPAVGIAAERQTAVLSHVSLWRDVYYLNRDGGGRPLEWASPDNFPQNVVRLGDGEYFVMGDNSLISGDARYWRSPVRIPAEDLDVASGRVPERFMLGKAFFVYWPAGYRPAPFAPALTPNFGDMRFIR